MYAVYHGQEGIKAIAESVHRATAFVASELKKLGYTINTQLFFDTIVVEADAKKTKRQRKTM
ncbi:glycine dehydrogenase [Stylonychia lemnae]|uniref:Glycine dehydrogenase n=1 Tax=Stylonychia lemnae TaxID=5949 RepID=A0A077ZWL1_STYLE|nr:glycine dehydrogenase [Stylonychia lemnae]|eukprot:CDW72856.1 glycine dehydrogenase [Stylonychia lemnae]